MALASDGAGGVPAAASSLPTPAVAARLLALNRAFYAQVGAAFNATRQNIPPGMTRGMRAVAALNPGAPLRVLDVGCGNARLARALLALQRPVLYTGIDADAGLLAAAGSLSLPQAQGVAVRLLQADIAHPGWEALLLGERFDLVACLATLHHLPGEALRAAVVSALAGLLAPGGRLLLSAWQFADSPRLAARVLPWPAVGLQQSDVEPGDALLPWDSGPHALRYVHLIDAAEMARLGAAAALMPVEEWRADGRSGNLTLYTLLEHAPAGQGASS